MRHALAERPDRAVELLMGTDGASSMSMGLRKPSASRRSSYSSSTSMFEVAGLSAPKRQASHPIGRAAYAPSESDPF